MVGWWLDLMILEAFANLSDFRIHVGEEVQLQSPHCSLVETPWGVHVRPLPLGGQRSAAHLSGGVREWGRASSSGRIWSKRVLQSPHLLGHICITAIRVWLGSSHRWCLLKVFIVTSSFFTLHFCFLKSRGSSQSYLFPEIIIIPSLDWVQSSLLCEQIHQWPTHQPPRWPSPGHAGSFSTLVTQTQHTPVHVRTPRHHALPSCLQRMGVSCSFKSHKLVHCLFDVASSYCNANPYLDTSFLIYSSATITSAN